MRKVTFLPEYFHDSLPYLLISSTAMLFLSLQTNAKLLQKNPPKRMIHVRILTSQQLICFKQVLPFLLLNNMRLTSNLYPSIGLILKYLRRPITTHNPNENLFLVSILILSLNWSLITEETWIPTDHTAPIPLGF